MLLIIMKISSIIKFTVSIMLVIIIFTQNALALSQNIISNNTNTCDWQRNNVFFSIHAYSDEINITNQSLPTVCYVKDVNLSISFRMSFWPLFIKIKVWNNSGLIIDAKDDHFYLIAQNFTGFIFHRKCLLGYVWYLYGDCNFFKMQSGY